MPIIEPKVSAEALKRGIYGEVARRNETNPESVLRFYDDPLGFVMWAYRWGLPGPLEKFKGPDTWQKEILLEISEEVKKRAFNGRDAVAPIRVSLATGHGIGKSTLAGWLVAWIMSTRRYAQGTVTANTFTQLETKTWASIQHWFKTSRVAADFAIGASGIQHRIYGKSWKCNPQTCKEENSESFAGQHAATSTSFYLFDESSSIPDKIWEVAEGGLTDGSPMFFAFGNPTRSSGKFYRINFGDERVRWNHHVIDARDCMMPNKSQIQEWIDDWGEDSDFVRVRVKGLPPQAGDLQYIPSTSVYAAQKRMVEVLADEPLIAGVDLARGGGDNAVVFFRRGADARSIKPIVIPGEVVRDSMLLVSKLADLTTQKFDGIPVTMWFLDGGGIGGPIIDRMVQLGHKNFIEIQFGSRAPDDRHFTNMRAYMWSKMRDWLTDRGGVDPKDRQLEIDLTGVGLANRQGKDDRILLESKDSMKKRGLDSPDRADALCLTFARPVTAPPPMLLKPAPRPYRETRSTGSSWMA